MQASDAGPASPGEEADRLAGLAERYGLRFMPEVADHLLDPGLVSDLPVEWAREHCLLPVRIDGETFVLCDSPAEVEHQEALALLVGRELPMVLAPREVILKSIERCYYRKEDSPTDFLRDLDAPGNEQPRARAGAEDLLRVAEEAPVTQWVNLVLLEAVKRRASDIHFEPFESRLRVRYRVDGVLYEQASPPKHLEAALVSRLKVMARMDITEKRLPQDGMAQVRVGERQIDIRASTVPVAEGERVVLRLLDRESALLPLESLGMDGGTLTEFRSLLGRPTGMLIVAGPTGSGKTTTLYAALGQLDAARKNILTIEEPIEYRLPDIGQIQVKPKIGLTFASGLRHILRQDPDIILVGETRDVETAGIAVRASLTGHLVFTTLHTNDAPSAVPRLTDMGVETFLLASCLRGVLAQRLVRRLCPVCRRRTVVPAGEAAALGVPPEALADGEAWTAAGCEACLEGYSGRTGLFELMKITPALQDLVRKGHTSAADLRRAAEADGMAGLQADGIRKLRAGTTSLSEVAGVAAAAG